MRSAPNFNDIEFIDEGQMSDFNGRNVDYSSLLWRQLDRIMKAGTYNADSMYVSAVLELHQLLAPYHTKKYLNYVQKLKEGGARVLEEYKPRDRALVSQKVERRIAYLMFGKLVNLMTGKDILPCKVWTGTKASEDLGV